MKESRVSGKWCPMARVVICDGGMSPYILSNRGTSIEQGDEDNLAFDCLAGGCAMWVQDSAPPETESFHGHCGLAK